MISKRHTFRGGIHPPEGKELSNHRPIEVLPAPKVVAIPLHQHIRDQRTPLVKRGDELFLGQKIAECDALISAPIHASVSGTVKGIETYPHPVSGTVDCIVIENDGEDRICPDLPEPADIAHLSRQEIIHRIREAGIVGLGGAAFPTHVKLTPPADKPIDTLILNGAECEPYLTGDHRLMVEHPDLVVYGAQALAKALDVTKVYIGVEVNKPDAIEALTKAASGTNIQVVGLGVKYPQGAEQQLIKSLLNREVPPGCLPRDVGVVVNNVGTAAAAANSLKTGLPLYQRIVTVSGEGITQPSNFLVRLGTLFEELIAAAGGPKGTPRKIIMGGPMTGFTQYSTQVPVVKETTGLLVFAEDQVKATEPGPCIKCGRCVSVCPQFLLPVTIAKFAHAGMLEEAAEYGILNCMECGSCSYVCPAHRFLVQDIKIGKQELIAKRRQQAS